MIGWAQDPTNRVKFAWGIVIASIVAWPVTAFTVFSKEPQAVMALSWIAIILSAVILLVTTDVRKEQDENGGTGE